MKVRPSVKPICEYCRIIKRHGVVRVICSKNPRHSDPGVISRDKRGDLVDPHGHIPLSAWSAASFFCSASSYEKPYWREMSCVSCDPPKA